MDQKETDTLDGIIVEEDFFYKLNDNGINEWYAQIQPGYFSNGERLTKEDCSRIAEMLFIKKDDDFKHVATVGCYDFKDLDNLPTGTKIYIKTSEMEDTF